MDNEIHDDEWDEPPWDTEFENESDEDSTNPCPSCGEQIFDDAEQCPYCQHYIVSGSQQSLGGFSRTIVWVLVLAMLLPALIIAAKLLG